MMVATVVVTVFAVLAADLIEEFSISRAQIGLLVTVASVGAGLVAPVLGSLADRIGGKATTLITLALSAGGLAAVSGARNYVLLALAACLTGIAQATTNPATNKLIADHVPVQRRAFVTGIKQSGPQIASFVAGVVLPGAALAFGWRRAVLGVVAAPVLIAVAAAVLLPSDRTVRTTAEQRRAASIPREIFGLALFGFLIGSGGTAVFTYLPLFAHERAGLSTTTAGALTSVVGLAGIAGRLVWARAAERRFGSRKALGLITACALVSVAILIEVPSIGASWLWVVAAGLGLSSSSWNSVGMLAVIRRAPAHGAGRASGIVQSGFLVGVGVGPPLFGRSVDLLGTYTPGLVGVAALFVLAGVVTLVRLRPSGPAGAPVR
jgi:predicted MFS family arabinose efflux permease